MNISDGIQIALGVVLTLTLGAVLWYAWEARKQAQGTREAGDASREMTREIREQRLAEHMPLLLIDLLNFDTGGLRPGEGQNVDDCYPANISFRLHNIGSGPAIVVDMTVVHPKTHYWRNKTKGYLLKGESIEYETGISIYQPTGLGLSGCLRLCGIDVQADDNLGLVVRYRDIFERRWIVWMILEYDCDLAGEQGDEVIWWVNESGQHMAKLSDAAAAQGDAIFFGAGHMVTPESSSTVDEGER